MSDNFKIDCFWDIMTEWQQCFDEGKDVECYRQTCETLRRKADEGITNELEDTARSITELMYSSKIRNDFSFEEPSDYDSIAKSRPNKRHSFKNSLSDNQIRSKIKGAWTGRIAGCLLGKPIEGWRREGLYELLKTADNFPLNRYITKKSFEHSEELIKKFNIWLDHCWADNLNGFAPVDDDTNYTTFSLKLLEHFGRDFTPQNVLDSWLSWIPAYNTFTAERIAYRNALLGLRPPESAAFFNPCREYIGAQIRGDMFGYVNIANPEKAAEMAWRDASISHVKNGIYGEMYIAAMIAAAAVCDDIRTVIEAGLDEIPAKSRLRHDIDSVIGWYESGLDAYEIMEKIHQCYDEHTMYGWCHTNSNAMIVTMALLCGEKDFGKSICFAVHSAFDTDCNGATVGSIIGIMNGIEAIPEYWSAPFEGKLATSVMDYTFTDVDTLTEHTIKFIQ